MKPNNKSMTWEQLSFLSSAKANVKHRTVYANEGKTGTFLTRCCLLYSWRTDLIYISPIIFSVFMNGLCAYHTPFLKALVLNSTQSMNCIQQLVLMRKISILKCTIWTDWNWVSYKPATVFNVFTDAAGMLYNSHSVDTQNKFITVH